MLNCRKIAHLVLVPISVFSDAMYLARPYEGRSMSDDVALQGSEIEAWELLEGKEKNRVSSMRIFYLSGSLVF